MEIYICQGYNRLLTLVLRSLCTRVHVAANHNDTRLIQSNWHFSFPMNTRSHQSQVNFCCQKNFIFNSLWLTQALELGSNQTVTSNLASSHISRHTGSPSVWDTDQRYRLSIDSRQLYSRRTHTPCYYKGEKNDKSRLDTLQSSHRQRTRVSLFSVQN